MTTISQFINSTNYDLAKNNNVKFGHFTINTKRHKFSEINVDFIITKLKEYPQIQKVEYVKKNINVFLNRLWMLNNMNALFPNTDNPKDILLEFSSPNTNKPQHLGHVRNNLIGQTVYNILKSHGHNIQSINLINDRGIHICKSMYAYITWYEKDLDLKGDHLIGHYYVKFGKKFNEEYEQSKSVLNKHLYFNTESFIGKQVKQMLVDWEQEKPVVRQLWNELNNKVYEGFKETYQTYGIKFDIIEKESEIYKYGKDVVIKSDLFEQTTKGYQYGEKVVLRADGTSIYITQDIGTLINRYNKYQFDELVYVVGNEQNQHFKTLFEICKKLQVTCTEGCRPVLGIDSNLHHLTYGMIHLKDGRMKSSEGRTILADTILTDVINLLVAKQHELEQNEYKTNHVKDSDYNKDEVNKKLALSAIKFSILTTNPKNEMVFDINKSIDIKGKSGPFILYTYARINGILKKNDFTPSAYEFKHLSTPKEFAIIDCIFDLYYLYQKAITNYDPSQIVTGLYNLCKAFSNMYSDKHHKIIASEPLVKMERLMLCYIIKEKIEFLCALLTIKLVEQV
jgi:arginyl-tRNA synthetase